MSNIIINKVSQHFGDNVALKEVNLEVREGEFFSLLGPSGCGKSTLLNIIAGFLEQTSGTVYIGGSDITRLPPYKRNIGMVFQNYALFPHLTVFQNVAYGLKIQKVKRSQINQIVHDSLSLVRLEQFSGRMPHQLSGGQQQRVAIARALAIKPSVLLLDEPLSNLDAKLRKEMQFELRNIQQQVGITTILVTHDQEEALSLSDRIGILGDGQLQQVGTPTEIYRKPINRFVAEFIGQVNLFETERVSADENGLDKYKCLNIKTGENKYMELSAIKTTKENQSVLFMLRPERINLSLEPMQKVKNQVRTKLLDISYIGNALRLKATIGEGEITVHTPDPVFAKLPSPGDILYLWWEPEDLVPLD